MIENAGSEVPFKYDLEDSNFKDHGKLFVFADDADPSYVIRLCSVPGAEDVPDLLAGVRDFREALGVLKDTYGIPTPNPWFVIGKEVTNPKNDCVYTICERVTGVVLDKPENATPEIYFQLLGKLTRYHIDVIFSEGPYLEDLDLHQCMYGTTVSDPEPRAYLIDLDISNENYSSHSSIEKDRNEPLSTMYHRMFYHLRDARILQEEHGLDTRDLQQEIAYAVNALPYIDPSDYEIINELYILLRKVK